MRKQPVATRKNRSEERGKPTASAVSPAKQPISSTGKSKSPEKQGKPIAVVSSTSNLKSVDAVADGMKSLAVAVDAAASRARAQARPTGVDQTDVDITRSLSRGVARPGRQMQQTTNRKMSSPVISSVEVGFSKGRGAVDGFFARLTLVVSKLQLRTTKAFKIFRALSDTDVSNRPVGNISFSALEAISSGGSRKNRDPIVMHSSRLSESAVPSSIGSMRVDPFTGVRSALEERAARRSAPVRTTQVAREVSKREFAGFISDAPDVDRSVADNLNAIKNIKKRSGNVKVLNDVVSVGRNVVEVDAAGMGVAHAKSLSRREVGDRGIVEVPNSYDFEEIATLTPSSLHPREIGETVEHEHVDPDVSYGRSYRYYAVLIDSDGTDSPRSEIVTVAIETRPQLLPPSVTVDSSSHVKVSFTMTTDQPFISSFEIYRRDVDGGPDEIGMTVVNTQSGQITDAVRSSRLTNGMIQVGEVIVSPSGGAAFVDRRVRAGRRYVYRIYCVDAFDNKSSTPFECEVFVKDPSSRQLDLQRPTIDAEVSDGRHVKLIVTVDDDRIVAVEVGRRDISTGEAAFVTPNAQRHLTLGMSDPIRSLSFAGPMMFSPGWNGYFQTLEKGRDVVGFVDTFTRYDHTYQYCVVGTDRFGNRTGYNFSVPLMVVDRPSVSRPIALSASFDMSGSHRAVRLSWTNADLDVEPTELIGNRKQLGETSVRTLYQVERKKKGAERWEQFSMVDVAALVDPVSVEQSPTYRPPYLIDSATYAYRVMTFQSGSLVSSFSDPIEISTRLAPAQPTNLKLRAGDARVKPTLVTLNWDDSSDGSIPDGWIVERVAINNFIGKRINVQNVSDLSSLSFVEVGRPNLESSRGLARTFDPVGKKKTAVRVGSRAFVDRDVELGNTYFYRVRSIFADDMSAWSYKGIVLTERSFEMKANASLTQREKSSLALDPRPMKLKASRR